MEEPGSSSPARDGAVLGTSDGLFGNRLLAALPEAQRNRVAASITVVRLSPQEPTNTAGLRMHTVDFPIDALMAVVSMFENGSTCEVAAVGREGFVEIDAALASRVAHRTSFCQIAGRVARMPVEAFLAEVGQHASFEQLVLRSVRARVFMAEQLAACNLKHSVVERFARWLLMTQTRVGRADFNVTHEFLAMMLGARRASVSEAAATLQAAGCINYRRGTVTILDTDLLASRACECFRANSDILE